jgi:hypothetical protein
MFSIGDTVRVLAPFDVTFPDTYVIEGYSEERDVYQICGDRDFSGTFLEKVE